MPLVLNYHIGSTSWCFIWWLILFVRSQIVNKQRF